MSAYLIFGGTAGVVVARVALGETTSPKPMLIRRGMTHVTLASCSMVGCDEGLGIIGSIDAVLGETISLRQNMASAIGDGSASSGASCSVLIWSRNTDRAM